MPLARGVGSCVVPSAKRSTASTPSSTVSAVLLPDRPLTETEIGKVFVVQLRVTPVTGAPPIVPVPPAVTLQVCVGLDGCCVTAMVYGVPLATAGNENVPDVTEIVSVPSESWRPPPSRFATLPEMPNAFVPQLTATVVTGPLPTVPTFPATEHDCVGPVGDVATSTSNARPLRTEVANVNELAPAATLRRSPPLFERTSPAPASPVIVPPTVNLVVWQLTATLGSAVVTVPVAPLVTRQTWVGRVGWA